MHSSHKGSSGRKRGYEGGGGGNSHSVSQPSRVLHLKDLVEHTVEFDIVSLLSRFGNVKYVSMMPDRGQALVEFYRLPDAINVVERLGHEGLVLPNGSVAQVHYSMSPSIVMRDVDDMDLAQSPCLSCIVFNADQYELTADVIKQIVSNYANPKRILITRKRNVLLYIEFDSINDAKLVKRHINGADIYPGCCTLKVDYGVNIPLRITFNNSEQWDRALEFVNEPYGNNNQSGSLLGAPQPRRNTGGGMDHNNGGMMNDNRGYGGGGGSSMRNNDNMYNQPQSQFNQGNGGGMMNNSGGGLGQGRVHPAAMNNQMQQQMDGPGNAQKGVGTILMVHGLLDKVFTCNGVFNLLCQYGDVIRVKFLKSKPGTAMVEMGSPEQAETVLGHLIRARIGEHLIQAKMSYQTYLSPPKEPFDMENGGPSFKEYFGISLQRFSRHNKSGKNRFAPPCKTLHFWNAPNNLDKDLFFDAIEHGGAPRPSKIIMFESRDSPSSSGLVEFETDEEALIAMCTVNHLCIDPNYTVIDTANVHERRDPSKREERTFWILRMSYSINPIRTVDERPEKRLRRQDDVE